MLVFFNDILVYSPDIQVDIQHLEAVFSIMKENSPVVKRSKCSFGSRQIKYLRHIISAP